MGYLTVCVENLAFIEQLQEQETREALKNEQNHEYTETVHKDCNRDVLKQIRAIHQQRQAPEDAEEIRRDLPTRDELRAIRISTFSRNTHIPK